MAGTDVCRRLDNSVVATQKKIQDPFYTPLNRKYVDCNSLIVNRVKL